MKWISIKDQLPIFGKRVLVCMGIHLPSGSGKQENFHWMQIATYCCSGSWKIESYEKKGLSGQILFWKDLPSLEEIILNQPERLSEKTLKREAIV